MRIALIGSSLGSGGAERVLTTLANAWAGRHEVALITIHSSASDFFVPDPRVSRIALSAGGNSQGSFDALGSNWRRLTMLRRALRSVRADVAISFMTRINVLALLAAVGLEIPVIVSERTDTRVHPETRPWRTMQRLTYWRAFAVVAQTQPGADHLRSMNLVKRVEVIPNPVIEPHLDDKAIGTVAELPERYVVAMGRLSPEKGFDMLLRAFSAMQDRGNLVLVIIGEGEERRSLQAIARDLKVEDSTRFMGALRNPFPVIRRALAYVLSSRFEGFPNALAEAMACGVPGIAFDSAGGPAGIIRDGIDGILVPQGDVEALARSIEQVVGDRHLRDRLAGCAADVLHRFDVGAISTRWENLLKEAISGGNVR